MRWRAYPCVARPPRRVCPSRASRADRDQPAVNPPGAGAPAPHRDGWRGYAGRGLCTLREERLAPLRRARRARRGLRLQRPGRDGGGAARRDRAGRDGHARHGRQDRLAPRHAPARHDFHALRGDRSPAPLRDTLPIRPCEAAAIAAVACNPATGWCTANTGPCRPGRDDLDPGRLSRPWLSALSRATADHVRRSRRACGTAARHPCDAR